MKPFTALGVVLRFVSNDGEMLEIFLGFSDVSTDRTASAIADRVIDCILQHELIAK